MVLVMHQGRRSGVVIQRLFRRVYGWMGRLSVGLCVGVILLCFLLVVSCARVVAPTGGPKDADPPRVLRTVPPEEQVNFEGRRLRFYFNEYVKVVDADKNLVISPPLPNRVTPLIKGKSVEINLRDTLRPGTTYVVDFGTSIVDLTEGNPLGSYRYVFSTGDRIDSCVLQGRVRGALDRQPVSGVKVMLYRDDNDSAVYQKQPDFWTLSDASGNFTLTYLPAEEFRIVALEEKNNNYLLDQAEERVGFRDVRVRPECRIDSMVVPDSLVRLNALEDSVFQSLGEGEQVAWRDSVLEHRLDSLRVAFQAEADQALRDSLCLELFTTFEPPQVRLDYSRPAEDRVNVVFSLPPEGEVRLDLVDYPESLLQRMQRPGVDTVVFWIGDTLAICADTLVGHLHYQASDSLGLLQPRVDTLRLVYASEASLEESSSEEADLDVRAPCRSRDTVLGLTLSVRDKDAFLSDEDTIFLRTARVIRRLDTAGIRVIRSKDTVAVPCRYEPDALDPRQWFIFPSVEPGKEYRVVADSLVVKDIWGWGNRKVEFQFRGVNQRHYATLHLDVRSGPSSMVIEVIDHADPPKVIRRGRVGPEARKVDILYIPSGSYRLRIIDDRDGDGEWSGGHYLRGIQPEAVRIFRNPEDGKETVNLRQNWEYDLEIDYDSLPY